MNQGAPSTIRPGTEHEAIVEKRSQLIATLCEVNRQFNSLTPLINKLPTEIIVEIFLLNARLPRTIEDSHAVAFLQNSRELPKRKGVEDYDPIDFVVTISRVCHRWRVVALDTPSLWNFDIDCHWIPNRWLLELMRRSSNIPLRVSFKLGKSFGQYHPSTRGAVLNLKTALHELSMLGRLTLGNALDSPNPVFGHLLEYLTRSAPAIESFSLTTITTKRFSQIDTPARRLPLQLFNQDAPNLKYLSLDYCIPDLRSPIMRNLRQLYIRRLPPSSAVFITKWVSCLQDMPYIEHLCIDQLTSNGSSQVITRRSSLNRLVSLDLHGCTEVCTSFMRSFFFPRLSAISIQCDVVQGPDPCPLFDEMRDLFQQRLPTHTLPNRMNLMLRNEIVSVGNAGQKNYQSWMPREAIAGLTMKELMNSHDEGVENGFSFKLRNTCSMIEADRLNALTQLLSGVSHACTFLELDISRFQSFPRHSILSLLQAFPAVRSIFFQEIDLDLLLIMPSNSVFPALQHLVFERNFHFHNYSNSKLIRSILDFAQIRQLQGIPIRSIELRRGFLNSPDANSILSLDGFSALGVQCTLEPPFERPTTTNDLNIDDILFE